MENLVDQVDASTFLPNKPKKPWSVCMSLQWHPKSDVPFCAHDCSAMKVFCFEKSNQAIILKVKALLFVISWHFSISKAETQLFEKINYFHCSGIPWMQPNLGSLCISLYANRDKSLYQRVHR